MIAAQMSRYQAVSFSVVLCPVHEINKDGLDQLWSPESFIKEVGGGEGK